MFIFSSIIFILPHPIIANPLLPLAPSLKPLFPPTYRIIGWISLFEDMPPLHAHTAFETGSVSSPGGSDSQNPPLTIIVFCKPTNVTVRNLVYPRGGDGYEPSSTELTSLILYGNPSHASVLDLAQKNLAFKMRGLQQKRGHSKLKRHLNGQTKLSTFPYAQ